MSDKLSQYFTAHVFDSTGRKLDVEVVHYSIYKETVDELTQYKALNARHCEESIRSAELCNEYVARIKELEDKLNDAYNGAACAVEKAFTADAQREAATIAAQRDELFRTLESERRGLEEMRLNAVAWKNKYYDVADAITAESHGVEDLCNQARSIRAERDELSRQLTSAISDCMAAKSDAQRMRICIELGVFPKRLSPQMDGMDWVMFVPGNGPSERFATAQYAIDAHADLIRKPDAQ